MNFLVLYTEIEEQMSFKNILILHFIFHFETSRSVTSSPAPGAFYSITRFIYNPYPTLRNYLYDREANISQFSSR